MDGSIFPGILYSDVVLDNPLSSDFEIRELRGTEPETPAKGTFRRDGEGRTRWDFSAPPGLIEHNLLAASVIVDPVARRRFTLNHLQGTYRQSGHVGGESAEWYFAGQISKSDLFKLAGRSDPDSVATWEGVPVRRVVLRHADQSVTEALICDSLRVVVSEIWTQPSGSGKEFHLFGLRRGSVDSNLFLVPEGYRVAQ